ncbi:MAG: NPCBM/NEW2 domain-containing protein, partial [Pseudonocardia sp.]
QLRDIIDSIASLGATSGDWPPLGVLQRLAAYTADPPPPAGQDLGTSPVDRPGSKRRGVLRVVAGVTVVLAATAYGINLTSSNDSPDTTGSLPVPATSSNTTPPTTTTPIPTTSAAAASSPFETQLPPPTGEPVYLADPVLSPRGTALSTGSWTILDKEYPQSLAMIDLYCDPVSVTYELDHPYQRFITDVGIADTIRAQDRNEVVSFTVYADRNNDDRYSDEEEVVSRAGSWQRPAAIDVDIRGATGILLTMSPSGCISGETVWATPRLY